MTIHGVVKIVNLSTIKMLNVAEVMLRRYFRVEIFVLLSISDLTMNATSSLNFSANAAPRNAGKSVLPVLSFITLTAYNTFILLTAAVTILILMPSGWMGFLLLDTTLSFVVSYIFSISLISPTGVVRVLLYVIAVPVIVVLFGVLDELRKQLKLPNLAQ